MQRPRQRRAAGGFDDQPEPSLRLLADHHVGRTQFPQPRCAFRSSRYGGATLSSKSMDSFYDYVGWKLAWRGNQPDLIWDDEARGLCQRVYGDGTKSFIFLYCIDGHQRFIRIGQSPVWSLEAARVRANELRSIVDQGHDPRLTKYRESGETPPAERLIQYITEHIHTIQLLRR